MRASKLLSISARRLCCRPNLDAFCSLGRSPCLLLPRSRLRIRSLGPTSSLADTFDRRLIFSESRVLKGPASGARLAVDPATTELDLHHGAPPRGLLGGSIASLVARLLFAMPRLRADRRTRCLHFCRLVWASNASPRPDEPPMRAREGHDDRCGRLPASARSLERSAGVNRLAMSRTSRPFDSHSSHAHPRIVHASFTRAQR